MKHPKFHKRIDGICDCEIPLTCSVVPGRFWCGECGKSLELLAEGQIEHMESVQCKGDMDEEFYKLYGRYAIGV